MSEAGSISLSVSFYASLLGPSCHIIFRCRGERGRTLFCLCMAVYGGEIGAEEAQGTVVGFTDTAHLRCVCVCVCVSHIVLVLAFFQVYLFMFQVNSL